MFMKMLFSRLNILFVLLIFYSLSNIKTSSECEFVDIILMFSL